MERILTKFIIEDIYKIVDKAVDYLINVRNVHPRVEILMAGNNPGSISYVNMKKEACKKHRIDASIIKYETCDDGNISDDDCITSKIRVVANVIKRIPTMVQLPYPMANVDTMLMTLSNDTDVDGLNPENYDYLRPCTAAGIRMIFKRYDINISDMNIVIIGRSKLLGEPLREMLDKDNANITVLHSKTSKGNLKKYCLNADIIISTAGQANLVTPDMIREGVILIDTGYSKINGEVVGDINKKCWEKSKLYTPYTKCIGPLTIAILIFNIVKTELSATVCDDEDLIEDFNKFYSRYDINS